MALDMTTALTIKAKVTGENEINGLNNALGKTATQAKAASNAFSGFKGLGALVPAAAIAGVTALAKGAIDTADNLNDLSIRTGVAVESLSRFGAAAEDSGSSIDEVGKAMGRLARGIVDPASATSQALAKIGVATRDARGKILSLDEIMLGVADKFSKLPDGAEKTALAMELFGKSGANLIPMLNAGREELSQYAATINTEMAQAADQFNDSLNNIARSIAGPFNEAVTALLPLITSIAEALAALIKDLMPVLQPMIEKAVAGIIQIVEAIKQMPPGLQQIVVGVTAVVGVFALLAPTILTIIQIVQAIGGLVGALTGGGGLLAAITAVFTGPVGWVALLVAAGVAIYAFRDKVGEALGAIGKFFSDQVKVFNDHLVKPIMDGAKAVVDGIQRAFKGLADALRGPFDAVGQFIKFVFNSYIALVEKFINGAISGINKLVAGANRALSALKLPNIPTVSEVRLPRFATGGVVDKPTVALVGEGREREYIVPESKMGRAALNYLMGKRGDAVLRNEGGRTGRASASQGNTTIQVQTGPVLQQDGQRYVTIEDLERSLTSLAANLLGNSRSYAGRRYQGLA